MTRAARATMTRDAILRSARTCADNIGIWPWRRNVAAAFGVSPSTVSRHLRVLAAQHQIVVHRHGRRGLVIEVVGGGRTAEP